MKTATMRRVLAGGLTLALVLGLSGMGSTTLARTFTETRITDEAADQARPTWCEPAAHLVLELQLQRLVRIVDVACAHPSQHRAPVAVEEMLLQRLLPLAAFGLSKHTPIRSAPMAAQHGFLADRRVKLKRVDKEEIGAYVVYLRRQRLNNSKSIRLKIQMPAATPKATAVRVWPRCALSYSSRHAANAAFSQGRPALPRQPPSSGTLRR